MGRIVEVRVPRYPECWESCGSCAQDEVSIGEILVAPGDVLRFDDNVVTLETGKVALDIQSPHAGRVVEVCVEEGQTVAEGDLIVRLETD